jgi:GNAT superfamily N-acetyltransferase
MPFLIFLLGLDRPIPNQDGSSKVTVRSWVSRLATPRTDIWALFVDPRHERRGVGRRLHDTVVAWLWSRGLDEIWLTTESDTRAHRFYEAAGWQCAGRTERGELRFELRNPGSRR